MMEKKGGDSFKEIALKPNVQPATSLEAEVISPDVFAGKELREIAELEVHYGNRKGKLGDFFEVSGSKVDEASKLRIVINGDVGRTKRIGQGMSAGEIVIKGNVDMYLGARMNRKSSRVAPYIMNVDMYLGARMKGGRIVLYGNVDSFAGLQMAGGELVIKGNAANYLGAAYRGDWRGMKGGTIVVEGNVGSEAGEYMRGGKIHVKGNAGPFLGLHMSKGLIVLEGNAESRLGAQMTGGDIVAGGVSSMLPGFKLEGEAKDLKLDSEVFKGAYSKYSGDHAEFKASGNLYLRR